MSINSISFPEMFSNTGTLVISDDDATQNNVELLLGSCKGSLIGDPYFGTSLRKFLFEPNNVLLHDLIIDEIYVAVTTFIPQLYLKRNDITVRSEGTSIYATINCINKLDNMKTTYDIKLLTD